MSLANYPFKIFLKKEDADSIRWKDWYISIDIPLDPSNPNSQKFTHEYLKRNSTEIEEVLEVFSTFDGIVKTLALPSGPQRFQLIPEMMGHDTQKKMVQYCDHTRYESVSGSTRKLLNLLTPNSQELSEIPVLRRIEKGPNPIESTPFKPRCTDQVLHWIKKCWAQLLFVISPCTTRGVKEGKFRRIEK